MSPVLNSNQFDMSAVVGQKALSTNPNPAIFSYRYDPTATATDRIVAGEGVKFVDLGASDVNGDPVINKRTADTDAIAGVRIFKQKKGESEPGDVMEIATQGAVIYMNAGAAILRGALVDLVPATPGNVITHVATTEIFGVALDKATAADQLVRVLITARGFAELPLYNLP